MPDFLFPDCRAGGDVVSRASNKEAMKLGNASRYVYPRLLQRSCGKWFRIKSKEDILNQIEEFLEAFDKTASHKPLIEPFPDAYECPLCGGTLYEFFAELPTDYESFDYILVLYCLDCRKARVHRGRNVKRYLKKHLEKRGMAPIPESQTRLTDWGVSA